VSLLLALLLPVAPLVAGVTQSTTTALDAVAVPGAVTLPSASSSSTTSALDGTTSSSTTRQGEVTQSTTTALDATTAGAVTLLGTTTQSTTTALDGTARSSTTLPAEVTQVTTTALDGATLATVTLLGTVTQSSTTALSGAAGYPGPDAGAFTLALSTVTRVVRGSFDERAFSLSTPTRSIVSSARGIVYGDTERVSITLSVDTGTIAAPVSGALLLYAASGGSLAATIGLSVDSGTGTATVLGHVDLDASNTPPVGAYIAQVVLTYLDGPQTWPSNAEGWRFYVWAPGSV
jgi:hypothetical protein